MGLVLLLTFSKALGPTERVGLCVGGFCVGWNGGADDDDGMGAEPVVDAEGEGDGGVAV